MEDAEQYFAEIVEPTISDFEANPRSPRHAFLACVCISHTVDYLAHPRDPRTLRQQFCGMSPDFKLVDRVAHAFKHVVNGHPSSPDRPPLDSREVIDRPPAFWGTMVWNLSRWNDRIGGVTILNHTDIDLLKTIKDAASFLRGEFQVKNRE